MVTVQTRYTLTTIECFRLVPFKISSHVENQLERHTFKLVRKLILFNDSYQFHAIIIVHEMEIGDKRFDISIFFLLIYFICWFQKLCNFLEINLLLRKELTLSDRNSIYLSIKFWPFMWIISLIWNWRSTFKIMRQNKTAEPWITLKTLHDHHHRFRKKTPIRHRISKGIRNMARVRFDWQ